MTSNPQTKQRWIIEWQDNSAPEYDIRGVGDSIEETAALIQQFLGNETWTSENALAYGGDQTEPAYPALVRQEFHGDIHAALRDLRWERFDFHCDGGILIVERER